jgi:hypothetical protein
VRAVEQAILDGVDVINFSISGGTNPYSDIVSLAFAAAYENGVFVAASAGNSGPGANTVAHRDPWTTTVAASTSNRHFLSTLSLEADNGDTLELVGVTVTGGISTPTPVVLGRPARNCASRPSPPAPSAARSSSASAVSSPESPEELQRLCRRRGRDDSLQPDRCRG